MNVGGVLFILFIQIENIKSIPIYQEKKLVAVKANMAAIWKKYI